MAFFIFFAISGFSGMVGGDEMCAGCHSCLQYACAKWRGRGAVLIMREIEAKRVVNGGMAVAAEVH